MFKFKNNMSLKLLNNTNTNENGEITKPDPDQLIECGIDTICQTFKSNIGNYIDQVKEQKKIINELTKKLELMKEEIGMIQRENQYYKVQNEQLKNEIEKLNKVVNSIKGKLTKFDFKINNKGIIENINNKNININSDNKLLFTNRPRGYIPFNNFLKKDNFTYNDIQYNNNNKNNIFSRDRSFKNLDKNSKTIRFDINRFHIDDINESDINNVDNNIDIEQELNIDNFKKNFNVDNNINLNLMNEKKNINIIKSQKQKYTHLKNKKIEPNCLSDLIDTNANFQNNTINIKLKDNNRNYNNEKKKVKKQTNNSLDIPHEIVLSNRYSNINFNSNKSEKELFLHKKINEMNKIRSNSSNNAVIKRDYYKNEIKNLTNRNNGKEEIFQMLNEKPLPQGQGVDNMDGYNKKICRTYQNQKNSQKRINNNDNLNGNASLKELKIKEMTFFLKKCKVYLDQITFENVVKIFQDYKKGIINDDSIIQKMKNYLKNNSDLLNLFNNIIT